MKSKTWDIGRCMVFVSWTPAWCGLGIDLMVAAGHYWELGMTVLCAHITVSWDSRAAK